MNPSPNDQVHAAGAFEIDFKTHAAARSRATPGSLLYRMQPLVA
jgi:hypothetical protein